MSYVKPGYPIEYASKLASIKILSNKFVSETIGKLELEFNNSSSNFPSITGAVNINESTPIKNIITVDGGESIVEHSIKNNKRKLSFIQVGFSYMNLDSLEKINKGENTTTSLFENDLKIGRIFTVLPHRGAKFKDKTVADSAREIIHKTIEEYNLYDTLKYLVYREYLTESEWNNIEEEYKPSMDCINCRVRAMLPRGAIYFKCKKCNQQHTLSDYLNICSEEPDSNLNDSIVSSFRNVLEVLVLFCSIIQCRQKNKIMLEETLFIKDGPLLLSSSLSRITQSIRYLLEDMNKKDEKLYLVGIEKTGYFVDFLDEYTYTNKNMSRVGEYYIPNTLYLLENIAGRKVKETYTNRVNYGYKVGYRAGKNHILALNIPIIVYPKSNKFKSELKNKPQKEELIGLDVILKVMPKLISYSYANAIIPLVLINNEVSIADKPNKDILNSFTNNLMGLKY